MTNEHIITEEMVESKEEIEIYYDYENKKNLITLNKEEREINQYKNNDLDITIVQILEKDDINEFYFLLPNLDYKNLKDKKIYIPQFPEGNDLSYSKGEIIKVKKYELFYNASTKEGSSGSPIFLKNTTKVIGIHKQGNKYKEENYGNFIFPIIYMLNDKNIYYDDQYEGEYFSGKFEGKGKYVYDDGEYYIGEWKNGLRNGKGKKYYKNGNIKFEGEYFNDKQEGKGKYFYNDGKYYIGEWKNGIRQGNIILYYSNGNIMYDGEFVNDKFEGKGKYIYEYDGYYIGLAYDNFEGKGNYKWEDKEYYIGEFKNGLRNGNGIQYYPNGNIKYDGEFINNKFEGKGKYIYEDGEYFIGEWKNGLKNGKGTEYYSNNNIKYEGEFVNDNFEGKGKYIWEDSKYYIGEFQNGLKNGKGVQYYKNGNIQYEGFFVNNRFKGPEKNLNKCEFYIGLNKDNDYFPPMPLIITEIKKDFNSNPLVRGSGFENATIQCLFNIDELVNYFKYNEDFFEIVKADINKEKLCSAFKLYIEYLYPYKLSQNYENYISQNQIDPKYAMSKFKNPYQPSIFKEIISKKNPLLFLGISYNVRDLIPFLLNTLHEELNKVSRDYKDINISLYMGDNDLEFQNFIKDFAKNDCSIISDLFYAIKYDITQCDNCKVTSYNYQIYFFLIFHLESVREFKINNNFGGKNLENKNDYLVDIYDCFEYDQKLYLMEGDNALFCRYCEKTCNSSMRTCLKTGPEILIIILNRGKGNEFDIKINFYLELNLKNYIELQNTGYQYELFGVINPNEKSINFHLIAYCKDFWNNQWLKFEEDYVTTVNDFKKEVIDFAKPYALFYRKKIHQ